jgi:hypothetical protein
MQNPDLALAVWYLALRAVDRFHAAKGRYPGATDVRVYGRAPRQLVASPSLKPSLPPASYRCAVAAGRHGGRLGRAGHPGLLPVLGAGAGRAPGELQARGGNVSAHGVMGSRRTVMLVFFLSDVGSLVE